MARKCHNRNQFGDSDSDHLGKVITYAAHHRADYAIWIVEKAREEHISAIQMLNDSETPCNFYFVEAKAVSIGESKPAVLFSVVCEPANEKKETVQKSSTEQKLMAFGRLLQTMRIVMVPIFKNATVLSLDEYFYRNYKGSL